MHAAGLVGSKLTVGHGGRAVHAWIGRLPTLQKIAMPHGRLHAAHANLDYAHAEMRAKEAPDQPLQWKWRKHIVYHDRIALRYMAAESPQPTDDLACEPAET